MTKLSIIIPVFNEKDNLEKVLSKLEELVIPLEKEIILVDDCSIDGTREIVKDLGDKYKIFLHEKNSGKGAAVKSGLKLASGDYVIIQDADLEYDPEDYNQLIKELDNGYQVVYGSRNLTDNPRFSKAYYYGGKAITLVANMLYGSKLTDVNTCYKLFKTDILKSLNLEQDNFSFCEEATAKTLRKGIKIKEVPISYYPRDFVEGKKIRPKDGINGILTLLKYRFFYNGK